MELHPGGIGHREGDGIALELGGPSGHVVEQIGRQRHVGSARDADGLTIIQGLQLRQLLQVLVDEITQLPDQATALRRGHVRPRPALKGPAGGLNGTVDIFLVALRRMGDHLGGGRVDDVEHLSRGGVDPLPIDQELAPLFYKACDRTVELNFCCCDTHA